MVNAAKANPRLNWAKKICSLYVTVIRGTPVVLQLMIIYYIIFRSVQIPQIVVGGLAFEMCIRDSHTAGACQLSQLSMH